MDKYVLLDILHHYRQLQVYIYAFMYIDSDTMQVEDSFPATIKYQLRYQYQNIGLDLVMYVQYIMS